MEHIFVADTNLFLECKRLEDISWSDLGVDPVVIVLTKPVIGEIDKHKTSGGRTRKRALAISGRIRDMLKSGVLEEKVCQETPLVSIRLAPVVHPDPDFAEILDYSSNDDRIVGIVSAMAKQDDTVSVCFLTDDSVAASTAHNVGVPFRFIEGSWKRPPEQTTEAKRIKELEKGLATYRAQEPCIVLENVTDEAVRTSVVRRIALPLGCDEVGALVDQLCTRHPVQTEFVVPEAERWDDGTEVSYRPPDAEEVDKYKTEAYPGWLSRCRLILEGLHENWVEMESPLRLTWGVTNEGTRPAVQLRVTFVAEGSILLRRLSTDDQDGGGDSDTNVETGCSVLPQLPPPPKPPQVQRIVKRRQVVSRQSDNATVRASLGGLRMDDLGRISFAGTRLSDLTRLTATMGREQELLGKSVLRRINEPGVFGVGRSMDMVPAYKTLLHSKHDKEAFYYDDWPPEVPVKSGALTCDLYRHRNGEELFELEVLFPEDGDVRGAAVCTVHAENLTEPVSLRISLSRSIEEYSLLEKARALVESCGN